MKTFNIFIVAIAAFALGRLRYRSKLTFVVCLVVVVGDENAFYLTLVAEKGGGCGEQDF